MPSRILVALRVAAGPQRAFEAFTSEIGQWWRPNGLASFMPDPRTDVHIRFEPVGQETRVTVEHLGWDTVPPEHVARHGFPDMVYLQRHAEWWRVLLGSLSSRVQAADAQL